MSGASARTYRYVRSWVGGRVDLVEEELFLDRGGVSVPATFLMPREGRRPLPTWVVLHGITRPGREHAQLVRFTRAVAAGGCAVLVPEVPEWRELDLAPALTLPTILASLDALAAHPAADTAHTGLVGFSFGAPQALAAAAHPDLRERLAGVLGFGGYCDLERTILFQLTGRHEWKGRSYRMRPDPYGRWIVAANYLTSVPGLEDAGPVADGLRRLAALAGDLGVLSWDPELNPAKDEIRAALRPGRHRDAFDLLCPPGNEEPREGPAEEMAHALAGAARRVEPVIEPAPQLQGLRGPVHLLHGQSDHLIPFTEMLRLQAAMPGGIEVHGTVTPLFGHSAQDPFPGLLRAAREGIRFLVALRGALGVV